MKYDSKKHTVDIDSLCEKVLSIVAASATRITPRALEKKLFEKYELNKKQIKSVIRDLVAARELGYTYEYGSTYLERSFAKAVRISKHVVLQPPEHHYRSHPNDVVVKIKPGASFGAGNHPTTRLAIKGIEFVLLGNRVVDTRHDTSALDIGTGSGVLLITAILCGLKTGLGIDIDACARVEAAANVRINGLEDRVVVSGQSLADIRHRFPLILANLRYPSLKMMLFLLNKIAETNSYLILSGIRDDELDDLVNAYKEIQFKKIWSENELGWAGVVLRRRNRK
jgi:ribosomal protein L11 methyltransferase